MTTQRVWNNSLDVGHFFIIFSIFAGMMVATIAYLSVVRYLELDETLVYLIYTAFYLFFAFRYFNLNFHESLSNVSLILKGYFYLALDEIIPRFQFYSLIISYGFFKLISMLLDIPVIFVIVLSRVLFYGSLFFFHYLRLQFKPYIRSYSQSTGAIGADNSNPWMKQNWVGVEPFNLPSELVQWICGYTDAEGSFLVSQGTDKITGEPRGASLTFQLRVHIDSLPLLEWLKDNVFGSGSISVEVGRTATLHVSSFRTIIGVVIPLFNQFTLNTKKFLDFKAFEEIAHIMANKGHLTPEGSRRIYKIRRSMNNFRTNYDLPSTHSLKITNYWLLGFVEGDGTFYYSNTPRFSIAQEDVSLPALQAILAFFGKGSIKQAGSDPHNANMCKFLISDMQVLYDDIVPFFSDLHFFTTKGVDFQYWRYLVELHRGSYHLTDAGKEMIKRLISNMNQRHLTTQILLTGITPDPVLISSIQDLLATPAPIPRSPLGESQRTEAARMSHPSRSPVFVYSPDRSLIQTFASKNLTGKGLHMDIRTIAKYLDTVW